MVVFRHKKIGKTAKAKYYIDYLYHTKVMTLLDTYMYKGFGQIYFKSEKLAEKHLKLLKTNSCGISQSLKKCCIN
jgi:hypothetical protein